MRGIPMQASAEVIVHSVILLAHRCGLAGPLAFRWGCRPRGLRCLPAGRRGGSLHLGCESKEIISANIEGEREAKDRLGFEPRLLPIFEFRNPALRDVHVLGEILLVQVPSFTTYAQPLAKDFGTK